MLLRDGDTASWAHIPSAGRTEPLDFPGVYLRDVFTEGRHPGYVAPDPEQGVPVASEVPTADKKSGKNGARPSP